METSFTPGPWFANRNGFSTVYIEAKIGGGLIQEIAACGPNANGQYEQEANARLISAAPELLEALQQAIACGMVPSSSAKEGGAAAFARQVVVADMIRSAIAKAIGSQS